MLGYKIWFEEDINEVELTTSKHSSSFVIYAIMGIVGALAILLVVIVVSTSGNDTSSYQKIDKDTVQMQTFQVIFYSCVCYTYSHKWLSAAIIRFTCGPLLLIVCLW